MHAIRYDEYLDVFIKARFRPKAVALVAVNLVEGFLEGDPSPLELHVDEGEAVHEYSHVITVFEVAAGFVLMDYLQEVVLHVFFVDEPYIFGGAVIALQDLYIVLL